MDRHYIYTVTQLNNQTSNLLNNKFSNIWVKGEISSPKSYPSGYTYFVLRDNRSAISCIAKIKNFNIKDGTNVTINGNLNLYVVKGSFQIVVTSIYPTGDGELWMKYLSLKNMLENEGIFESVNKKVLPRFPRSIGIVTSLEGSVLKDIINIINRRAPYLKIIVSDAKVTGIQSSKSLIDSFINILKYNKIDLIILARGGGNFEDLMCFNDEILIREIYKSNIPVISAIGHETDFTLCDFVADFRASTPSEAAEICCPNNNDIKIQINNIYDKIYINISNQINLYSSSLSNYSIIVNKIRNLTIFKYKKEKLRYNYEKFMLKLENLIKNNNLKLSLYEKLFNSIDVNKIKKIGYSIVKKNDSIVQDFKKLKLNDIITIEFFGGDIKAKIKGINEK